MANLQLFSGKVRKEMAQVRRQLEKTKSVLTDILHPLDDEKLEKLFISRLVTAAEYTAIVKRYNSAKQIEGAEEICAELKALGVELADTYDEISSILSGYDLSGLNLERFFSKKKKDNTDKTAD